MATKCRARMYKAHVRSTVEYLDVSWGNSADKIGLLTAAGTEDHRLREPKNAVSSLVWALSQDA